MNTPYPITGYVLVGGQSSRMGKDKALIRWNGETLLSRAASLLGPLCESVAVIGPRARYASAGVSLEILEDAVEPCGPLGGILAGLRHSPREYALFLACDLPMMSSKFLHYLVGAALAERPDVAVPVDAAGEYQPLCAMYSRNCLPSIEQAMAAGKLKVSLFYDTVGKLRVIGTGEIRRFSPDFKIFTNVNTPEELAAAQAMEP